MECKEMFSLEGKVALVTGASHGIGFAIASALGEAGAKVVFNCHSKDHLSKALSQYRDEGIVATGYVNDVTDERQMHEMIEDIKRRFGAVDILVNNAATIKRLPMH